MSVSKFELNKNIISLFFVFASFFAFLFFSNPERSSACTVNSAIFEPSVLTDPPFEPSGDQKAGWFKDNSRPQIKVTVLATDCMDKVAEVSIVGDDVLTPDDDISILDNYKIVFPSSNYFTLHLVTGEDECNSVLGVYDCQYFIEINLSSDFVDYSSDGKPGGNLNYECDGGCDEDWILRGVDRPETIKRTTGNAGNSDTIYIPLAPIPGLPGVIDTLPTNDNPCPFGNYVNILIKIILGIGAVLAMVMIVKGGIEYMTTELISSKEAGRETVTNAILGLIIALGSVLILNTVNPRLLNVCLDKLPEATIVIKGPDAGDDTIDPDFKSGKGAYATGSVSQEVASAVKKMEAGWKISRMVLSSINNTMVIELQSGSEIDRYRVPVAIGIENYSTTETARGGDKKTPLGNWKIINIDYTPNKPKFSENGSNMGAAFWRLDPTINGERGIGIHGNKAGTVTSTNGCIRFRNADILALQPYVYVGLPVIVQPIVIQ